MGELMAEQYGVDDLLSMDVEMMRDLWSNFGLSCHGLDTPDAFIEQGLTFLPEVRPEALKFRVGCVHPIITDAEEVLHLEERQAQASQEGVGQNESGAGEG